MSDFNIQNSLLGKQSKHPERYDASVLFRIPRSENRVKYGLDGNALPFAGVDVWNCYEVSYLNKNGLPLSRVLKLIIPADSSYLVESKSLKLYLNSFNMEKFDGSMGEIDRQVSKIISCDLSALLECEIQAVLFDGDSKELPAFKGFPLLYSLIPMQELETLQLSHFEESPGLLSSRISDTLHEYHFRTDILRSNCRVTNQPDWGDLFVRIEANHIIDLSSVIAYVVSFRKENHFHEEVVEMIFKRLYDTFSPQKLMVAAMYTRRGGIDINPIRTTHPEWMEEAFTNPAYRLGKTLRQ